MHVVTTAAHVAALLSGAWLHRRLCTWLASPPLSPSCASFFRPVCATRHGTGPGSEGATWHQKDSQQPSRVLYDAFTRVPIRLLQGRVGNKSKTSCPAHQETVPGFGICTPKAFDIMCRFSFWSQKHDFTSKSAGGGTTAGAPTWPRVRQRHNLCTTEALSRTPCCKVHPSCLTALRR